jgi:hypothetical protein
MFNSILAVVGLARPDMSSNGALKLHGVSPDARMRTIKHSHSPRNNLDPTLPKSGEWPV